MPNIRSAVQDGNAGFVSAPSIKHAPVKQAMVQKEVDPEAAIINKAATGLGNAFGRYVKEEASNMREQQRLSGVAKAGMKKSMSEVDVDVKETGFTEFLFGDDIEYRAIQQKVITNGVEAQYRQELANIDQYQGYTEREYGQVLKDALDSIADKHKDDPETKALATNAWITASGKLVDKQHKTHFAYKQTEMRKVEHDTTLGRIDQLNIEEGEVTSPEDIRQYNLAWDNIFDPMVRPQGMSEAAKSSQTLEIVNETLASGTITAYKQGLLRNVWENAAPEQIAAKDKAIGKYDTGFNYEVNTTLEQTVASIANIEDNDQAEALIDVLDNSINQHETRQSGSVRSKDIIAEARARAARMRKDIRKAGAVATKKGKDLSLAKLVAKKKNPYEREVSKEAHRFTTAVWEQALNENFAESVSALVGEELNAQTAATKVLSDPQAAKLLESQWGDGMDVIPVLQSGFKGAILGIEAMGDPDTGLATGQWRNIMTTLAGYDRVNSARLVATLGKDDYKRFKMYEAGTRGNRSVAKMHEDANKVLEGSANKTDYANSINLPEGMNKRDYIVQALGIGGYSTVDQTRYVGYFDEGMNFSKGDPKVAKDYVQALYKSNEVRSGGVSIDNAKPLSAELGGYDVGKVLDFLQSDDYGKDLLKPFAGKWDDNPSAENVREFWQVPGLTVETATNYEGLWITSPSGKSRLLSTAQLEKAADMMAKKNKQEEFEEERLAEIRRKAMIQNYTNIVRSKGREYTANNQPADDVSLSSALE